MAGKATQKDTAAPAAVSGSKEPAWKQAGFRDYQAWLDAGIAAVHRDELAEIRTVLAKYHDEDEADIIMRAVGPAVKAGKQAGRRERRNRIMVPPRQPVPAEATQTQTTQI